MDERDTPQSPDGVAAAREPFEALLGSRRGIPDSLTGLAATSPDALARKHFARLEREVLTDHLTGAQHVLVAHAQDIDDAPLLDALLSAVAEAVVVRAAASQAATAHAFLDALVSSTRYADHLVIQSRYAVSLLHIWPNGGQKKLLGLCLPVGQSSETACGQRFAGPELSADAISGSLMLSFRRAVRGSWQDPPPGTSHCRACAEYERGYADCSEERLSSLLGEPEDTAILHAVSALIRTRSHQHLTTGALDMGSLVVSAEELWRDELLDRLAVHLQAGGEHLLRQVLGHEMYTRCHNEFGVRRRLRPDRSLTELLDIIAWRELLGRFWALDETWGTRDLGSVIARRRGAITRALGTRSRQRRWWR